MVVAVAVVAAEVVPGNRPWLWTKPLTSLLYWKERVVDSPGDNILAEFPSVVDSIQCAVEIQNILKAKNECSEFYLISVI